MLPILPARPSASTLACLAINHLLQADPAVQSLLTPHYQRTIVLRWDYGVWLPWHAGGEQAFYITDTATISPANNTINTINTISTISNIITNLAPLPPTPIVVDASANMVITLQAGVFTASASERLRYIRFEGDALFAQSLALIMQQLRWDVEHDLAKVVGDVPAYWLGYHAKQANQFLQPLLQPVAQQIAQRLKSYLEKSF